MSSDVDIAIIGAGAAGLAAAIFAAESRPGVRSLLLDGAAKPGAKILVSGGGRCNVTNERVTADDYCGGSRNVIARVLRAFDEQRTIEWMKSMGVDLVLEPTGKYFPVTNKARTVLDALLGRARELGVKLHAGWRVADLIHQHAEFFITRDNGEMLVAPRVIMATGGMALPKSGSDGAGLHWMKELGHGIVPTVPALAPLVLKAGPTPGGRFEELAGVTLDLRMVVASASGKKIAEVCRPAVFTHFGLSGPAAMDVSRHIARYRLDHGGEPPRVTIGHPQFHDIADADKWLLEQAKSNPRRTAASAITGLFPDRMAEILAGEYGRLVELPRELRHELARRIAALPIKVIGDRGYTFAEATAGGVDLSEVDPRTMESRAVRGLYLCGEILDVDGRIGGFNFQWAWSSGYLAGRAAALSIQTAGAP
ncbi:MAG: aminoacetone oxidase family FAD-binding enzyme [Candidatus Sumerlaeaceae bacterium]|nr:aminoacetone oxidase family FAD-binding enzyme [Candidatus Sumerlaeaceae bacterium]